MWVDDGVGGCWCGWMMVWVGVDVGGCLAPKHFYLSMHETNFIWLQNVCCLLVGCLTSQQHASVSQGRICTGQFYVLPH